MASSLDTVLAVVSAVGGLLSGVATFMAVRVSARVHRSEQLWSQRQQLLPLWDHMPSLSQIDPAKPITPDILKTVNTLELVALCVEGGIVDPKIIKRTFREAYTRQYLAIQRCENIPGLNKTGSDLLRENRAAQRFYRELEVEHLEQDRPDSKL
jgi:hypothetical protein